MVNAPAPVAGNRAPLPLLFTPLCMRGLTLKNRVMISAMATYSSSGGFTDDFHLVHLGRFALGGAGLIVTEATAVTEDGRITPGCAGLWLDAQIDNLRRITAFLHKFGAAAGMQLGHSGWKGATRRPWHGGGPLTAEERKQRDENPWEIKSSSSEPFTSGWARPHELTRRDLDYLVDAFGQSARRANEAEFDVIELHCAHGYLLHSFLSPLANYRSDDYGGTLEKRMRFPLRVAQVIRQAWPTEKPMFVRISSVDGLDVGWRIEDSITFAKELRRLGVDAIDCSSGGMNVPRGKQLVSRAPGAKPRFRPSRSGSFVTCVRRRPCSKMETRISLHLHARRYSTQTGPRKRRLILCRKAAGTPGLRHLGGGWKRGPLPPE